MPFGLHFRRAATVMLTVVALVVPASWAGATDRPATAPALVAQAWTSAAPAAWGTTAVTLAAGRDRQVTLDRGDQPGTRFVLQVESVAVKAGDLVVATPGTGTGTDAAIAFPVGTAAATTLVTTDADGRVRLRSSVATVLRLTVVAHVAGVAGAPAAAGDTVLVPASAMIDQDTGVGGTVPTAGTSVVPVAALHGVPAQGARAVWLSVAARGAGAITFGADSSAPTATVTSAWGTSLVLAPVDEDGSVRYRVSAPLSGLRVSVLGWVADGAPAAAGALSVTSAKQVLGTAFTGGTRSVKVVGGAVPAKVDKVLLQVGVRTGILPGTVRVAATAAGLPAGAGAPLPLLGRTTVTLLAPVASDGTLVVSVPLLAQVSSVTVLGYTSAPVAAAADTVAPTLTIESPAASVEQATTPQLTVAGTASDSGSGVRGVQVQADGVDLGPAALVQGAGAVQWHLDVPAVPGDHTLRVTATDWAGRSTTVDHAVTVTAAAQTETIVAPDVTVLDGADLGTLLSADADQVVFAGPAPVHAGDVLVSAAAPTAPDGLLRRVVSVERVGTTSVVRTVNAEITDAILQADIDLQDVPLEGATTVVDGATGVAPLVAGRSARALAGFEFTIEPEPYRNANRTLELGLATTVKITVTLVLDVDLDVSWESVSATVNTFSFAFGTEAETEISAKAQVVLADVTVPVVRLPSVQLGQVTVMAGPVPLVFLFAMNPSVYFHFEASVGLTTTFTVNQSAKVGVRYHQGTWSPISTRSFSAVPGVRVGAEAKIGAGLAFDFSVKLYGVVGPYVGLTVGPEFTAEVDLGRQTLTNSVDLVFGLRIGAKIQIPLKVWVFSTPITLLEWSQDLGQVRIPVKSWGPYPLSTAGTDPGDGDPGDGDPGDGDPGDGDPGDGDPGSEPGFGLTNVGLSVCVPNFRDSVQSFSTTVRETDEEAGVRSFDAGSGFASAARSGDWMSVEIHAPGVDPEQTINVFWDHDPENPWGFAMGGDAYNQAHNGRPDVWLLSLHSLQTASLQDGFSGFTIGVGDGSSVLGTTATAIVTTREFLEDANERFCSSGPGQTVGDGRPGERGLHWDSTGYDQIQFSLEQSRVPAAATSVVVSCVATDGAITQRALGAVDSYGRWTSRFSWEEREIAAFVGTMPVYSVGELDCSAEALDDDLDVLATYPVIGGAFTPYYLEVTAS